MRKYFLPIIIGLVLLIVGGLICNGTMKEVDYDFTVLNIVKFETELCEISDEFQNINIQGDNLNVLIEASKDEKCQVSFSDNVKSKHTAKVKDDTLMIKADDGRDWYEHFGVNLVRPEVIISLPKERYEALVIEAANGSVTLSSGMTFQSVCISLDAGEIECLTDVEQSIELQLGAGDIQVANLHAAELKVNTATASVEMEKVTIDRCLDISLNAGSAELTDVTCGELRYSGNASDLELERVLSSGDIRLKNTTGDISFEECDAKEFHVETVGGDVEGTILTDKAFKVDTVSGSVRVPDTNDGGDFNIKTVSGDVKIRIERERGTEN